ncbi:MAG: DUF502 domain-containing protein, partial [Candidatus Binatia bacterium]
PNQTNHETSPSAGRRSPVTLWAMIRHFTESLRRYFLSGLLAFLPLAITIWMLDAVIRVMDSGLEFLPKPFRPSTYVQFRFPGMGAVFTFLLICLIGVFVTHFVGHKLRSLWERTLRRIPVVRGIYGAVQQLLEALFSQDKSKYRRVVLIEYPRKGVYCLGLVTGVSEGEVQDRTGERVINVFIPTTPNPTSGWYALVPEKDAITLDMSVEDAFKLIISGGMVVPKQPPQEVPAPPRRATS